MIVGIDPFSDDEPMAVYQNILKGKVRFPSSFNKDAKSLVKHLLVAELAKRYGNLKRGVKDITEHWWFKGFDWKALEAQKIQAPFLPTINSKGDTSNFTDFPESQESAQAIPRKDDVFYDW